MSETAIAHPAALVDALRGVAREAGDVIMDVFVKDFDVFTKDDESPVTEADQAAEKVILAALNLLTPDIPVIAEEEVAAGRIPEITGGTFWLVDPLDGTREFVNRRDSFTVNMGLIVDGEPVLGVVYAPALDLLYTGNGPGTATMEKKGKRQDIACRAVPPAGLTVIASLSHANESKLSAFLADYRVAERINAGSSLKFCRLAEGAADLYPRLGPTCEWDTAAGHAVLIAAGGEVVQMDGSPFCYGKGGDFKNPNFIARSLALKSLNA